MFTGAKAIVAGLLLVAICCSAAPPKGTSLTARTDGVKAINEPCYVHDSACAGYPVCCVTVGTCISQHSGTISSNTAYYEGGCQSFDSSKKTWANTACKQQGECLVQHLDVCKGGTTKSGYMSTVPEATMTRLMTGSCGIDCPNAHYGHGSRPATGTTTTTTTVLTSVTQKMKLKVANVAALTNHANFKMMLSRTIASLAGFGSDHSMVSLGSHTPSASFEVEATLKVSSVHKLKPSQVEAALKSVTASQFNEALAMRIGTCSYTATMDTSSQGKANKAVSLSMYPAIATIIAAASFQIAMNTASS